MRLSDLSKGFMVSSLILDKLLDITVEWGTSASFLTVTYSPVMDAKLYHSTLLNMWS